MTPAHPKRLGRPGQEGIPTVLITGVDELAMASAALSWQWDLPTAVTLTHRIDVESQQLHRTVTDVTGVLEREVIDLEHACVACAIREDIVPTLIRLAELERWASIVAHLPLAAEAEHVCRGLAMEGDTGVSVVAVVCALQAGDLVETLTGDALLAESGRETSADDRRGVAETAGALVEYADVLMLSDGVSSDGVSSDGASADGFDLVRALARPGVRVVGPNEPTPVAEVLEGELHDDDRSHAWSSETRRGECPAVDSPAVWRLDLRSDRPFHPERLHHHLQTLGSGEHRSRGCFWLPSRRGQICLWNGAGGQVSIGALGPWGRSAPMTRLLVTGLTSLTSEQERAEIVAAFEACLLTDAELAMPARIWRVRDDGFDPWLGAMRRVA